MLTITRRRFSRVARILNEDSPTTDGLSVRRCRENFAKAELRLRYCDPENWACDVGRALVLVALGPDGNAM